MANLTNSAKLIQEMSKKANRTELPEVNNSTVNFTINGNTGSQSMTTNQPNNSTVNLTVDKTTVGLGNVDNTSDANKPISTATQAALDLKADKSDLSSVYKYKGSVASYSNLPSTGLTAGDVYNVADSGMNYAWTGSAWDALGSTVDLSNYVDKSTNQTIGGTKTFSTSPVVPSKTSDAANTGTAIATEAQVYLKANASDVNTKTFYLSSTSDITTAQAAYDWYKEGKNPIIVYDNQSYSIYDKTSTKLFFVTLRDTYNRGSSYTTLVHRIMTIFYSSDAVSSITTGTEGWGNVLETSVNYGTPFTPTKNGHPATKKYVDDQANTAGNGIDITSKVVSAKIGTGLEFGDDYSAMRGPCPAGFHVPSKDEWLALCGILTTTFSLDNKSITTKTYLKMPCAGRRDSNGNTIYIGSDANYWSSTSAGGSEKKYMLISYNSNISTGSLSISSFGAFIRGFKDQPIIPNNSWTTLYDGSSIANNAGVFWNSSLGLISISGNGTTWYTIADKNLGATTVYNNGDTLTNANCGNVFQWGNNYPFPGTESSETITTSSTAVDASGYGPGNYYSSSTYITATYWDSSDNKNLRGGVTGVITDAITNTGVLSVNGQTGDVTTATVMTASGYSQVSNPVAGKIYFIKQS